jgi:glycosyltransferase involved in cell wall biosynthesis
MYIVVDKLQSDRGGAEKVLKELCCAFPDVTIYTTTVDDIEKWTRDLNGVRIIAPFWGALFRHRLVWFAFYPLICFLNSFVRIPKKSMALVYSSSAGKFINLNGGRALLYTNFPARGIFAPELFFRNPFVRAVLTPLLAFFKRYEIAQYKKFHNIYCISEATKSILAQECGVFSTVINCPISAHWFNCKPIVLPSENCKSNYEYVLISRLTQWKQIDYIFDYFEGQTKRKLHIIGTGELLEYYKARYVKSCIFHGFLEESDLKQQIQQYKALIFPTAQEWGLPLIEANACGLPVVAIKSTAVNETQIVVKSEFESGTCVVYDAPLTASIESALDLVERVAWSRTEMLSNADRFRPELFHERIQAVIHEACASR